MSSLPRRRATTLLTAAALALAASALPAFADTVTAYGGDSVVADVTHLNLGNVCAGAVTSSRNLGFSLVHGGKGNVWADDAKVTIAAPAGSIGDRNGRGTVTLPGLVTKLPSDWADVSTGNNTAWDAGHVAIGLVVPSTAKEGPGTTGAVTYTASGYSTKDDILDRTVQLEVDWNVVQCPTDRTPPVVASSLDPSAPTGDNGWYTGDVALHWTVSDPESPVSTTGCEDATVDTDGVHAYSCTAVSEGGTTGPVQVTVKRDSTAPTVTPTVTGQTGSNGWYVGDVNLSWAVSDDGSGVAVTSPGCDRTTLASDTVEQTYTCTVTDLAGNRTVRTVTIKRDATEPTIGHTVTGTVGTHGWYTSDVSVEWAVDDATSGVATTTGCDPVNVSADTAGTSFTCTAVDNAGNGASDSVTVKRDATAPEITFTRTGTAGLNGWFTGPVSLDWQVSDATAGTAATDGCDPTTVSDDTDADGVSFTCTATDEAGNVGVATAVVRKDATPPTVTHDVAGSVGDHGWYTGDATVTFSYGDAGSGVASTEGCDTTTVSEDTTGQDFACAVSDEAGNTATDSATVKRDATAPQVDLTGGPAAGAAYFYGDPIPTPTCAASDATSGVSPAGCTVTGGATEVGDHTFIATAADNAGNTGSATVGYTVKAWTLDGFSKPVNTGTGVLNTVKAGSTVPLKFGAFKGSTPITTALGATFSARKVTCSGDAITDAIDEFSTTGQTSLRYDASAGQWIQNWATPTAGAGSCYRVTLATADHSSISADFLLK